MIETEKTRMDLPDAVPILAAIIERERAGGCPMASPGLIEPALRRWKSYERRNKRNKDKSLEHRVLDLTKGLLALYPDHRYDKSCLSHLAESFAEALSQESLGIVPTTCHASPPGSTGETGP
jgi:hypothetical protein